MTKNKVIVKVLNDLGLSFVDNRNQGGCLWIKGGKELKHVLSELENNYSIKFTYKDSCRAYNGNEAWWTSGEIREDYAENKQQLIQFEKYSREEVCKFFQPDTIFLPGAGTWGLHGLVRTAPNVSDFVIFMTVGASQAGIQFNEKISDAGIFEWHSQPSLRLGDKIVLELQNHNHIINNIYAFYRNDTNNQKYVFLGKLKFLAIDKEREAPVSIFWEIIDWDKEKFEYSINGKIHESTDITSLKNVHVTKLALKKGTIKCLAKNGIDNLQELFDLAPNELLSLSSIDEKSYLDIVSFIKANNENLIFEYHGYNEKTYDEKAYYKEGFKTQSPASKFTECFEKLDLRSKNVLNRQNIYDSSSLLNLTDMEIMNWKNCGIATKKKIVAMRSEIFKTDSDARAIFIKESFRKINDKNSYLSVDRVFPNKIAQYFMDNNIYTINDVKNADVSIYKNVLIPFDMVTQITRKYEKPLLEIVKENIMSVLQEKSNKGKINELWERNANILLKRAQGHTLEESGKEYNITRERIRQIEKKFLTNMSQKVLNDIAFESLLLNILSPYKYFILSNECDKSEFALKVPYAKLVLYAIKNSIIDKIHYIEEYDMIILGYNWYDDISAVFERMPNIINQEEQELYCKILQEEFNKRNLVICSKHIEYLFDIEFLKTGAIYSKKKLDSVQRVSYILKEFFSNGIAVYNESDLGRFRKYYLKTYGIDDIPASSRALASRIINKSVLIDRGVYKLKEEKYISDNLANMISEYIDSSPRTIFTFSHLFNVFEEELKEYNVFNRHHLLGIIKETFPNEYYTKRDYLSKEIGEFSIYDEIVDFVQSKKYPVTKQDILNEIHGLSDISIVMALNLPEIINLFGSYLHIENLNITNKEKLIFKEIINEMVKDKKTHNSKELGNAVQKKLDLMLKRNGAMYTTDVFALAEKLFPDDFQFKRPCFAKKGVVMAKSTIDSLREYVVESNETDIDNIMEYARNNHVSVYSIVDFLDSINDKYFIKNSDSLILISEINIDEEFIMKVRAAIQGALKEADWLPIRDLHIQYSAEDLGVELSDWLIYSIIKKHVKDYLPIMSCYQFKRSIPLVCKLDTDVVKLREDLKDVDFSRSSKKTMQDFFDIDIEFEKVVDSIFEDENCGIKEY